MNLFNDRTEPTKRNVTTSTRDLCTLYRQVAITKQQLLYVYFKTIAHNVYVQVQRVQYYRLNVTLLGSQDRAAPRLGTRLCELLDAGAPSIPIALYYKELKLPWGVPREVAREALQNINLMYILSSKIRVRTMSILGAGYKRCRRGVYLRVLLEEGRE